MTTTCRGIVKGSIIELELELPFPDGTQVEVEVDPVIQELPMPSGESRRRFWATVGIGASGLNDVARNKYQYLDDLGY